MQRPIYLTPSNLTFRVSLFHIRSLSTIVYRSVIGEALIFNFGLHTCTHHNQVGASVPLMTAVALKTNSELAPFRQPILHCKTENPYFWRFVSI